MVLIARAQLVLLWQKNSFQTAQSAGHAILCREYTKQHYVLVDKGHFRYMQSQVGKKRTTLFLLAKCAGILLFFGLAVIVVACGSDTSQVAPGTPVATLTIVFGQSNASPTPPLAPYYCGGWATDTTPAYSPNSIINVYGKFTQTVEGNPVGVSGASAIATVIWPDGNTETEKTTTTSDGLAVFTIAIQASAINHVVLVQMSFTAPNGTTCNLTSPAFFTALLVSPTPTNTAIPSPTSSGTATPSVTPSVSPSPGGTGTPTVLPSPTKTP